MVAQRGQSKGDGHQVQCNQAKVQQYPKEKEKELSQAGEWERRHWGLMRMALYL